jgi:DNA repair photolyase
MPGINDDPRAVREIVERARDAGARNVTPVALHLRPGVREVFMDWLEHSKPELVGDYAARYSRGAYLPADERRRLGALVRPEGRGRPGGARFERPRTGARRDGVDASAHPQRSLF